MNNTNECYLVTFQRPLIDDVPQWKCIKRIELKESQPCSVSYNPETKELSVVLNKRVMVGFSKRPDKYLVQKSIKS